MGDVLRFHPRDSANAVNANIGGANLGSLYDMNRYFYSQMPDMDEKKKEELIMNIAMWFSSKPTNKFFMMLCRELNDYTIFHFEHPNYSKGKTELEELLKSRGQVKDIYYNHDTDTYDFWLLSSLDGQIQMYKIFMCDDFIIQI